MNTDRGDKLQVWIGSRRSRRPSAICRRSNIGDFRSGFASLTRSAGMSRWTGIPRLANWISCSRKPKVRQRRAFSASGRHASELHCHSTFLGVVPRAARGHSKASHQELPLVAPRSPSPFAPLSQVARQRGPLQRPGGRSLSRFRQTERQHDHMGLDRHPR